MREHIEALDSFIGEAKLDRGLARRTRSKVTKTQKTKNTARPGRFPSEFVYDGMTYVPTGKKGTMIATGKPSQEYHVSAPRIWVDIDGVKQLD
jgi:hypothetical protein